MVGSAPTSPSKARRILGLDGPEKMLVEEPAWEFMDEKGNWTSFATSTAQQGGQALVSPPVCLSAPS